MSEQNEVKAQPASVSGEAQRIPAAVKAQAAVVRATIHITRKATGLTETYELVGTTEPPKAPE